MPPRLDDQTREAVIADIRAGQLSRNAIADKHQIGRSTVTKLAKQAGADQAFDRSATAKATEAARLDAKALRAALIADLYSDAQRFRERSWAPYTQVITGGSGPELVTTKLPPLRDQQAGYTALAICLDKALKLEQVDADGGAEAGRTMVGELRDALGLAYTTLTGQAPAAAAHGAASPPGEDDEADGT